MFKDFKIAVDSKYIKPIEDMSVFVSQSFNDRRYFAIIYGSLAHHTQTDKSDIDILVCAEKVNKSDIKKITNFIVNLHLKYKFNLDSEIEYQNKVIKDYSFMSKAISGRGFIDKNNKYSLPTIIKSPEYLNSEILLLRFFLGALAHKHILFSGNEKDYCEFVQQGRENLLKILLNIKGFNKLSHDQLIDTYIFDNGVTGDYYLGFEDLPYIRAYLSESLLDLISSMKKAGKVDMVENNYVFSLDWLKKRTEFKLSGKII